MQGIIVLIVYALLMVGATKAFTKREDGGESFHVGHRNMGMVVSAMSIAATWIWAEVEKYCPEYGTCRKQLKEYELT